MSGEQEERGGLEITEFSDRCNVGDDAIHFSKRGEGGGAKCS